MVAFTVHIHTIENHVFKFAEKKFNGCLCGRNPPPFKDKQKPRTSKCACYLFSRHNLHVQIISLSSGLLLPLTNDLDHNNGKNNNNSGYKNGSNSVFYLKVFFVVLKVVFAKYTKKRTEIDENGCEILLKVDST